MGYKRVILNNPSHITDKESRIDEQNGERNLKFSRHIYQRLGSLTLNKTIESDYENNRLPGEYVRFLDLMDTIMDGTVDPSDDIIETDAFLGSLGLTASYKYSEDFNDLPVWVTNDDVALFRNVGYDDGSETEYNVTVGADNVIFTNPDI